jgi:hypothetical protein
MNIAIRTLGLAALLVAASGTRALSAQTTVGSFSVTADKDAMTDEDRSMAAASAARDGLRDPVLAWLCMEDGLNIMYKWDKYFIGEDDEVEVMFRLGDQPAMGFSGWGLSVDNTAAFIPMRLVNPITQQAMAASRIVMRVRDSDGEELTDAFNIDGLGEALKSLPCATRALAGQR